MTGTCQYDLTFSTLSEMMTIIDRVNTIPAATITLDDRDNLHLQVSVTINVTN